MLNRNYDQLFLDQAPVGLTVNFVSIPFQLNHVKSDFARPQLKTQGSLASGTAKLQTLRPDKNLNNADMSVGSADWVDTPDTVSSLMELPHSSLNYRLKLTNLGALASFSAWVIYNAE